MENSVHIFRRAGGGREIADAAYALGLLRAPHDGEDNRQSAAKYQQIAPSHRADHRLPAPAWRAVTSISIFMRGSISPQMRVVAAGRIVPNASPSTGTTRGQSAASGR